MNTFNFKMNNVNYLPQDLMSLIMNMRTESMKKDLDKQIEEWKEESEDDYIRLTNEIDLYFIDELPIFEHLTLVEDATRFSPYEVLRVLREEKQERIEYNREIEEDFGNYYN